MTNPHLTAAPAPDTHHPRLRPGFGLATATSVVVASMVGVGILTTSGFLIKDTGSQTLMLGLWLLGGLLALCGAVSVAELTAAMPQPGGEYVFIRESYGRLPAFLYGWVSFLIGFSAPAAIAAHAAARYLLNPWIGPGDPSGIDLTRALAAGFLIAFTVLHARSHAVSSWVQSGSTILKLGALAALLLAGFACRRGAFTNLTPDLPPAGLPWSALGISLVYVMFSYSGWNAATYLAGETRQPHRTVPRALLLGGGAVAALYLLLNLLYVYALPPAELARLPYAQVEPVAALAAGRLFGPRVSGPFSMAVGLGLLASLSAFVLTGPRVYHAMARDGLFPTPAARLNPRTGTPNVALLAQAACALLLLLSGTFKDILTYTGVGLSLSSFFVILSVFVLRFRRPDLPRPFRIPAYPIPPLLFLVCTAWMIIFAFIAQPLWSIISAASILAGIPIYELFVKSENSK